MFELTLVCLVAYIGVSVIYNFVLLLAFLFVRVPGMKQSAKTNRFGILVPAHNEEILISSLCENMQMLNYRESEYQVFIVADNCTDGTAEMCSAYPVEVLVRNDRELVGKGFALKWALEKIGIENFDAILIIDADTTVDADILNELNKHLNNGEEAIQCYIELPNRFESWFTQIIFVSRTINNMLYHFSKYKMGLAAYLMGSGMCFKSSLLAKIPWTAFSPAEDWEYYALIAEKGHRTSFAKGAKVFQLESKSLEQATTQRLRWSSGRFYVAKRLGFKLLAAGLRNKDYVMADASLALILPNLSLLVNLILLSLACCFFLPGSGMKSALITLIVAFVGLQGLQILTGVILAGAYRQTIKSIMVSPAFLIWKLVIDVLCFTGIHKGKKWIRTKRHAPDVRSGISLKK